MQLPVTDRDMGTSRRGSIRVSTLLLTCGVVAGPLYVLAAAAQATTREGFDIRRHAVSLLSNGPYGWIQITNFVVVGLLVVLGAIGMVRTLKAQGGKWGPRLISIYGLGLVVSGLLVADPAFGFPIGAPDGPPVEATWQGVGHFVAGGIGFTALAGACFVFARHHWVEGNRRWSAYSVATGVVFFGSFAAVASGGGASWANLTFTAGVVLAWTWLSLTTGNILVGLRATTAEERGVER